MSSQQTKGRTRVVALLVALLLLLGAVTSLHVHERRDPHHCDFCHLTYAGFTEPVVTPFKGVLFSHEPAFVPGVALPPSLEIDTVTGPRAPPCVPSLI